MKKLVLFCLIINALYANAQRFVKGAVHDETDKALPFAAVILLQDSTPVATYQTEDNGFFQIAASASPDSFLLRVSYIGYETFSQKLSVGAASADTFNLGVIKLTPLSKLLGEALIVAQREPVQVRGDTIEFAASGYKAQPNAAAEDLIKKMPSIEIEKNGTIRAKGEEVRQILVNGKPFFGKDPRLAMQNLPADAIESVQVFEKKSDQAEFSGIDNGEREMTINIIIKPEYNRRVSGRGTAGVGTNERYLGRGNFNRFTDKEKLTALVSGNNINKTGFSQDDFLSFTNNSRPANPQPNSNVGKGFQQTQSGGLNLIENWGKSNDLNLSYFYNNQENKNDRVVFRQNFLPTGTFTSRTKSLGGNYNRNHRLNGYIDQKLDSVTSYRFTAAASYTENGWQSQSQTDNLRGDTARQSLGTRRTNTEGSGISASSSLLVRRRLGKAGRTASVNLSYSHNEAARLTKTDALTDFYSLTTAQITRTDRINQTDDRNNSRNNYAASASYTEPLSKKWLFEANYRFSYTDNAAERRVDSIGDAGEKIFRPRLSALYSSDFAFHRAGFNLRFNRPKLNFSTGVQGQRSLLRGDFTSVNQRVRQPFAYVLPNARLDFNTSKTNRLNFFYETDVREPSIEQLQPVQDNADPFNLYLGNPDLQPEYTNRLRLGYTNFNRKTSAYVNGNLNFSYVSNKIVNALSVDSLLRRVTQPINIGNPFLNTEGHVSFGFRFWEQRLRVNWTSNVSQSQGVNPVNGANNFTNRLSLSGSPRVELRFQDTFELALRATVRYNQTRYSIQTALNQTFWIYEYEAEMTAGLPFDTRFNAVFDYNLFTSNTFGVTQGIPILNLAVSKFLDKRKWEIRLAVVDVLNRNTGINRTADANYVQEEIVRSLGRYALVTATYTLNRGQRQKRERQLGDFENR